MHGAELAEFVRVADFEPDALSGVRQILRIAADNGKRMDVVVAAERGGASHHSVRIEDAAIAQFDFVSHDGVWPDSNSTAQPRRGRDCGAGIDLTH
jgi:hypothetical protein